MLVVFVLGFAGRPVAEGRRAQGAQAAAPLVGLVLVFRLGATLWYPVAVFYGLEYVAALLVAAAFLFVAV